MTNIEIKARYSDRDRAEQILSSLGAGPAGVFQQKDTYFNVTNGRLKLRQLAVDQGQLIYYRREDTAGPKRSDYEISATTDPEALCRILNELMGSWIEVTKTRQVWLWENVRIHLDDVEGLGKFVELEAVTEEQGVEESRERVETLMRALEIGSDQLIEGSYSDMIAMSDRAADSPLQPI